MNRIKNIKLYDSDFDLLSSLYELNKIATFEVARKYQSNLFYNLFISKSLKVLYFTALRDKKNILIIKKSLKNRRNDKDKSFNESFNFLSFLTKIFKFTIYSINFEIFKS